jgi:hypothetical protein
MARRPQVPDLCVQLRSERAGRLLKWLAAVSVRELLAVVSEVVPLVLALVRGVASAALVP